jgi:signal transduction histidine kinase
LIKALRTHTAAVEGRIGLPVLIEADEIGRLPIAVEDALYRIGQEALHNVVKHANARGVRIEIREEPPNLRFVVEDDGVGFDETAIPSGHLGLAGMRARAEKIGARLSVTSRAGRGTRIEVLVPLVAAEAPAAREPDGSAPAPDQSASGDEAARSI